MFFSVGVTLPKCPMTIFSQNDGAVGGRVLIYSENPINLSNLSLILLDKSPSPILFTANKQELNFN